MIVLYQIACLFVTLYVLQNYITSGVSSSTHRLLPLVLGLIGVYNFSEVFLFVTGEDTLVAKLEDLLLVQMLYLLFFYSMDFLHRKLPALLNTILFVSLLSMDLLVFLQYEDPEAYRGYFRLLLVFCIGLILALGTYIYVKRSGSEREQHVFNMVYLGLLIPAAALGAEKLRLLPDGYVMPAALVCTCLIINHLIQTDQLVDTISILQEELYEHADIAVLFFDADCCYLGANQAAKRLFPKELSVVPKKSRPELYLDKIRNMAKNPERQKVITLGERYYTCQLTPMYYHERLRGYSLSVVDITAQKKETKMMAALKDSAETQTELKSQFLAHMSHDLKSPLHAIIGISDILAERKELSEKNRSLILHIQSAGNALLEQVNAILDYSRLEAGRLSLSRKEYGLEKTLEELAHMCAINLRSKPIKFSISVLTGYPEIFLGDEMRVREIIQNLLSNAVKFTERGEIRCEIICDVQQEEKKVHVTCSVTDTGPGVKREQLDKIFGEYVVGTDGAAGGSGLGLNIVKQLTELMGGSVRAVSDGTSGTTVTASFVQEFVGERMRHPISFNRESVLRRTSASQGHIRPRWLYPGARVLLADDMRINQEIFREYAGVWEFAVDAVKNGREAVEAAGRQEYQIIFLDQMMPEMKGDEAAKIIGQSCDTPLILITAESVEEAQRKCHECGFADFLVKPMNPAAFQKVIEQYMPKEYRRDVGTEGAFWSPNGVAGDLEAHRRTLETFVKEAEPLLKELPQYARQDGSLFRIKVHGLKGAGRGIGRLTLGEWAEVMEMAAKAENVSFIEAHMGDFLQQLAETIGDVREELAQLPPVVTPIRADRGKEELFAELKAGFDAYNLEQIEKNIRMLKNTELSEAERALLSEAEDACEELDYERGSEILSER